MMPGTGSRQPATGDLAAQRKLVRRAMGQGRRWYLRAVLMVAIAVIAAWRGGQLNYALGVVMILLATMGISLGRSIRRSAQASLEKLELLDKTEELGG